jgi:hypothetical protein
MSLPGKKPIMTTESLETRAEDGDFKFIFKTLGRKLSAEEAQFLSLEYRGEHVDRILGQALEVDLRPAFEKSLDQVEVKFRAVPWKRDPPATTSRFMTEFSDKLSLVRGVCESWCNCNDEQRKAACRAIFWLCDQLLEDIDRRCPEEKRSYVRGKILSLQDRAEKGRTSGDFDPIDAHQDLRHWFGSEQSGPVVAHEQCIETARAGM